MVSSLVCEYPASRIGRAAPRSVLLPHTWAGMVVLDVLSPPDEGLPSAGVYAMDLDGVREGAESCRLMKWNFEAQFRVCESELMARLPSLGYSAAPDRRISLTPMFHLI
jgi:hypothetical protein